MFGPFMHSFMIAQVFGLYLVMMAIVLLGRAPYYRKLFTSMQEKNPAIPVSAALWLLIGLFLILIHNDWALEPRLIVTILGWVIVLKSVFWLAAPESMVKWSKSIYSGPGYYVVAIITGLYGVLLLTKGFYPVL